MTLRSPPYFYVMLNRKYDEQLLHFDQFQFKKLVTHEQITVGGMSADALN
jgi:hypothetical protein